MDLVIRGKAAKYGDNIDADRIWPHRYFMLREPGELARYAMADVDPDFQAKMAKNGIMVTGKNFGCGSGRDWAVLSIKQAGAKVIIAESFGRLFFRNSLNYGLPVMESPGITEAVKDGDEVEVNLAEGTICIFTSGDILKGTVLPQSLIRRIQYGGMIPQLRHDLGGELDKPCED